MKNKNKFFNVKNSTEGNVDFYIYGDIIGNTGWKWDDSDVMPDDIKKALDEHKGKNINLYVNSGGGSVFAGLAIYNMLKRHDGEITAYVDGLAGSSASVIIMAASKIYCPSNAFVMIHKAWTWGEGNSTQLRKMADDLDRIDEGILNTYKENLKDGVDIQTIKDMVEAETWLTGEQASQYFNIETTHSLEAVACVSDYFKSYKSTPNNIIQDTTNKKAESNDVSKLTVKIHVDTSDLDKTVAHFEQLKQQEEVVKNEIENFLLDLDLI
jgi:ATP-dependent protease ClpP protease subunit